MRIQLVLLVGLLVAAWPAEAAFDRSAFENKLAQMRAEQETRLADVRSRLDSLRGNEAGEAGELAQGEETGVEEDRGQPMCDCRSRLSFAPPNLHFSRSGLVFTPRVNMRVYGDGEEGAPPLNVAVSFEGDSTYSSEDVSVPDGIAFSGSHTVLDNVSCEGGFDYDFGGRELGRFVLPGISLGMVGDDEEIEGKVRMEATLSGCEEESGHRWFPFDLDDRGLSVRGWRLAR